MFKNNSIFIYLILLILLLNFAGGHPPLAVSVFLISPILGLSLVLGFVVGITIHEFSHALVAYRLGDPTAKLAGRLNLNPASHLDPFGTLLIFLAGFGWGKPTPFDPFNLRNIKRDSALISVAGAASNFLMAFVISLPYLITYYTNNNLPPIQTIYFFLAPFIWVNIILGLFNLIPVAPLDGFKVLGGLLPKDWYYDFMRTEPFGIIILIFLIVTPILGNILLPATSFLLHSLLPNIPTLF